MNTKISFTMKTFICTTAFILTTIFSFANGVENNLLKPSKLTIKNSVEASKHNASPALTLSYDVATFCAGARGYSKPIISEDGGIFSFKKNSDGKGSLGINLRTGIIDQYISDAGEYTITYSKGGTTLSTIVKVNSCK
jgi:hypothetical protein